MMSSGPRSLLELKPWCSTHRTTLQVLPPPYTHHLQLSFLTYDFVLRLLFAGKMFTYDELMSIKKVLDDHPQIIVITDEVYEFITFGTEHIRMATLPGELK
jgi:hypothetical protein